MNNKRQNRLMVPNWVERGMMTAREAGEVLGLSLRQVKRILAAYRRESAAALAHGNPGRKPEPAPDHPWRDLSRCIFTEGDKITEQLR